MVYTFGLFLMDYTYDLFLMVYTYGLFFNGLYIGFASHVSASRTVSPKGFYTRAWGNAPRLPVPDGLPEGLLH